MRLTKRFTWRRNLHKPAGMSTHEESDNSETVSNPCAGLTSSSTCYHRSASQGLLISGAASVMRKKCPVCGSRKWRKDAVTGNAVCEDGHVFQVSDLPLDPMTYPARLVLTSLGFSLRKSRRRGHFPYPAEAHPQKGSST
jgi:hypothetical protein